VNNQLVGDDRTAMNVLKNPPAGHVLIGAANPTDVSGGRFSYGNVYVDEVEFWYKDRDSLIASGYIVRGQDDVTFSYMPFMVPTLYNDPLFFIMIRYSHW